MPEQAERNIQLIRDLYAAYLRADLLWLQRHTATDVVLLVAGNSRIGGRYFGLGAALAFGAGAEFQFVPQTLEVLEVTGDDECVRTTTRIRVRGSGQAEMTMRIFQEYRFDAEGRISFLGFTPEDQEAFDDLVGRTGPSSGRPA